MSKVRINDLARELEVKSREILDALTVVGVTEKKTHSSSLEGDEAERVRAYLQKGSRGASDGRQGSGGNGQKPKIDWSQVSKPGDAMREILRRKEEAAAATAVIVEGASVAGPTPTPVPMVVNRPFLISIVDVPTGAVLFLGQIQDPTASGS